MIGGYHDNTLSTRGVPPLIETARCIGIPPMYSAYIAGGYTRVLPGGGYDNYVKSAACFRKKSEATRTHILMPFFLLYKSRHSGIIA